MKPLRPGAGGTSRVQAVKTLEKTRRGRERASVSLRAILSNERPPPLCRDREPVLVHPVHQRASRELEKAGCPGAVAAVELESEPDQRPLQGFKAQAGSGDGQ